MAIAAGGLDGLAIRLRRWHRWLQFIVVVHAASLKGRPQWSPLFACHHGVCWRRRRAPQHRPVSVLAPCSAASVTVASALPVVPGLKVNAATPGHQPAQRNRL